MEKIMKIGVIGINFIRSKEKFRSRVYQDAVGVWTNGYGHTEGITEFTPSISISEGIINLGTDIENVEKYINKHFKGLKQCQFDSLASLLFNIGTTEFHKTRLFNYLKIDNESRNIADEWIEFRLAKGKYLRGLMIRRLEELVIYFTW